MLIGTIIMLGLMRVFSALPLKVHYALGRFLSWFLKNVIRYRRDVVMSNLSRSFPDKKYKELNEIADGFYKHFGRMIGESVWFGGCRNPERLRRQRLVEYSNIEVFEKAYSQSPGVMVMTSHFGNWELLGGCLNYDYRPDGKLVDGLVPDDVIFVYKPLKSRVWDEIIGANRCAPVSSLDYKGYISTGNILRHVLENKDRKLVVNMLSDQYPYRDSLANLDVRFLNQETKTMFGGASLARKLGWSVLYASLYPISKGHYEWRFTEICPDASEISAQQIMDDYYKLLQKDIEAVPWCYLWSHKRWKK